MPLHAQSTQKIGLLAFPDATRPVSAGAGGAVFGNLLAAAGRTATTTSVPIQILQAHGKPDQAPPMATGSLHTEPPITPAAGPAIVPISPPTQAPAATIVTGNLVAIAADMERANATPPVLTVAPNPASPSPVHTSRTEKPSGARAHSGLASSLPTQGAAAPIAPAFTAPVITAPVITAHIFTAPAVRGTVAAIAGANAAGAAEAVSSVQAGTAAAKPTLATAAASTTITPPPQAAQPHALSAETWAASPAAPLPRPSDRQAAPVSTTANHTGAPEHGTQTGTGAVASATSIAPTPSAPAPISHPLAQDASGPSPAPLPSTPVDATPHSDAAAPSDQTKPPLPTRAADGAAHAQIAPPATGNPAPAATSTHSPLGATVPVGSGSSDAPAAKALPSGNATLRSTQGGGKTAPSAPGNAGLSARPVANSQLTQGAGPTQALVEAGAAPNPAANGPAAIDPAATGPVAGTTQTIARPGAQDAVHSGGHGIASAAGRAIPPSVPNQTGSTAAATPLAADADGATDQTTGTPLAAAISPASGAAASNEAPPAITAAANAAEAQSAGTQPARTPAAPHAGKEQALPNLPDATSDSPAAGDPSSGATLMAAPPNAASGAPAGSSLPGAPAAALAPPSPAGAQLVHTLQNAGEVQVTTAAPRDITIHLQPGSLGSVQVRIERGADGAATVTLQVERSDTLRALQTDAAHLHQALDRAGLPTAGRQMSFELAQPAAGTGTSNTGAGTGASTGNGTGNGAGSFGPGQNGAQGGGGQRGQASSGSATTLTSEPARIGAATAPPRAAATGINITA